jgi:precorrin-2 dehydrogenase / sirohydrochlorin ferrochelatase
MESHLFPMFLKMHGRRCLVAGAGAIGESKIEGLLQSRAEVIVVAPQATSRVEQWANASQLTWMQREFEPGDLDRAFMVVAATSSVEINHLIAAEARRRDILCNVVDDPDYCDFFYPAVVQRGALQLAISTSGTSPALARRLREQLEIQFGPEYERWLEQVDKSRREILASVPDPGERRSRLEALVSEDSFRAFLKRK